MRSSGEPHLLSLLAELQPGQRDHLRTSDPEAAPACDQQAHR